ncbi:MAG: lipoate--protein ligase family protein [Candidatus Heimdallarchaeota archaeon]|nr:lipoate--protein ligase family protein [Candidatus Heimdallarchaeota archaeon]MBY8993269.1 lipoate--protein ligase family protein [Candidatus Heimdallarchaeota archaeon]
MSKGEWRLIWVEGAADCYYNMGLDKAIQEAVAAHESRNTIRLYRWKPSAVSIGYFQSMNKVVNIENCKERKVDYIRRITGGGAVYHDFEGELTYSVNCLDDDPRLPRDISKIYEKICGGVVLGLEELGIDAEFKPINDINLKSNGKKISGSALTRKSGVILQHGTILRKVNVEKMFSLLVIPDEKFKAKMISSAKERVSSLEDELGVAPSFKKIRQAMINGLSSVLDIELIHEKITTTEHDNANRIASELFKDEEWLFKR